MKKEYIYPSVKVYQLRHFGEAILAAASPGPTNANDDLGNPDLGGEDTRGDETIGTGTGDAI